MGKVRGGSEVARWGRWKNDEVGSWGFLVLFKGVGCRLNQRFHLFVSDVNQGKE